MNSWKFLILQMILFMPVSIGLSAHAAPFDDPFDPIPDDRTYRGYDAQGIGLGSDPFYHTNQYGGSLEKEYRERKAIQEGQVPETPLFKYRDSLSQDNATWQRPLLDRWPAPANVPAE